MAYGHDARIHLLGGEELPGELILALQHFRDGGIVAAAQSVPVREAPEEVLHVGCALRLDSSCDTCDRSAALCSACSAASLFLDAALE
eukprot:CAMPEP_0179230020 /NCGR_PEP_ID=MMETSP0797-20121207/10626_1 /TAXON_ID=47934 /ORGANISM="Dinophysis acuminata, Strain DAEP01" /LENGTH=87 /DNA_ID=CAMNT_0020937091 /DNA_START=94 /DNA_END=357 /DNA_ORIENTATION=-